jgi:hypothetical protein
MLRFIPRKLIPKLFSIKAFAENMQSPRGGVLGRLASELMAEANRSASEHAADRLQVQKAHTVLELGPGINLSEALHLDSTYFSIRYMMQVMDGASALSRRLSLRESSGWR